MDEATLEKNAKIVAEKLNEGYSEKQTLEVMKSAGYSDDEIIEIMKVAKILQHNQPNTQSLESAFGSPRPTAPAPAAATEKKSNKGVIIGAVVAIIVIIFVMLLLLKPDLIGMESLFGDDKATEAPADTAGTEAAEPEEAMPTEPEEPEEEYTEKAVAVKKVVTYDLDIEIGRIVLNDNKDQIDSIELVFTPKLPSVTKEWNLRFQIMEGDFAISQWEDLHGIVYFDANVKAITGPTKITYETGCEGFYCEEQFLSSWWPSHLESGTYELQISIINPTTEEVMYILTKDFSLGEAAPKTQE